MNTIKETISTQKLPEHIAIIMDGNGRWAKQRGKQLRIFGHTQGVTTVKQITTACVELGINYLTLYTFSSENWNRPSYEVTALMNLLIKSIRKETPTLVKNGIRLQAIGQLEKLPIDCQKQLNETIEATKNMTKMTLVLALSYSSQWDILNATKNIANDVSQGKLKTQDINENVFKNYLTTKNIPDPDLLIRTSGEIRISNFLLWELAYSELYFSDVLWPDFTVNHLHQAILNYQLRERRFGLTGEQLKK